MNKIHKLVLVFFLLLFTTVPGFTAELNNEVNNDMFSSMTGGNVTFNAGNAPDETKVKTFIGTYFSTGVLDAPFYQPSEVLSAYHEVPFYSSDELFTREEISVFTQEGLNVIQSNGRRVFSNIARSRNKPVRIYTLATKPPAEGNIKGKTFQVEGMPNAILETTIELAVASAYHGYKVAKQVVTGAYPYRIFITVMRQWRTESISNGNGLGSSGSGLAGDGAGALGAGFHRNKAATRTFYIDIVKVHTYDKGVVTSQNISSTINSRGMETIYILPGMKMLPTADKQLARNIIWLQANWAAIKSDNSIVKISGIATCGANLSILNKLVNDASVFVDEGLNALRINPGNTIKKDVFKTRKQATVESLKDIGAVAAIVFKIEKKRRN